ncbi:MAG: transglycosylase SLT domain-containing protein [Candidatus Micrarchaeia archaeon]
MLAQKNQNALENQQYFKFSPPVSGTGIKDTLTTLSGDIAGMKRLLSNPQAGPQEARELIRLVIKARDGLASLLAGLEGASSTDPAEQKSISDCKAIAGFAAEKLGQFRVEGALTIGHARDMADGLSTIDRQGVQVSFLETLDRLSRAFSELAATVPEKPGTAPGNEGIASERLKTQVVKTDLGIINGITDMVRRDWSEREKFAQFTAMAAAFEAQNNVTVEDAEKRLGDYPQDDPILKSYSQLLGYSFSLIQAGTDMDEYRRQAQGLKGNLHLLIGSLKENINSIGGAELEGLKKTLLGSYSPQVAESLASMLVDRGMLGLSKNDIESMETFSRNVQVGTGKVKKKGRLVEVPRYEKQLDMSPANFVQGVQNARLRKGLRDMGFFESDLDGIISGSLYGSRLVKESQMKNFISDDLKKWKPFDAEGALQPMTLNGLIWDRIPKAIEGVVNASRFIVEGGKLGISLPVATGDKVFDVALYLAAIGITESGLSPGLVSDAGAVGIYQILPDSAKAVINSDPELKERLTPVKKNGKKGTINIESVLNSYSQAPYVAAGHLADEQEYFKSKGSPTATDWRSLAAGYNAGPKGGYSGGIGSVEWEEKTSKGKLPEETQDYVVMVSMYARALASDPKFVELLKSEMRNQGIEFKGAQ